MIDVGFDLGLLSRLAGGTPFAGKTGRTLPAGTVEVPFRRHVDDGRYARFEVTGFTEADHKALEGPWQAALRAQRRVWARAEERRAELNPQGAANLAGEAYAQGVIEAEYGPYLYLAEEALRVRSRAVCQFGVLGWSEGDLRARGEPVPVEFADAAFPAGGTRRGLGEVPLNYLDATGLGFYVANAVLTFSEQGEFPSAAEQWAAYGAVAAEGLAHYLMTATGRAGAGLPLGEGGR